MAGRIDERWDASKQMLVDAAKQAGVDPEIMVKIAGFESKYNSHAQPIAVTNPKDNTVRQWDGKMAISTAYGYGQFVDDTWNKMIHKYGEKYGIPDADKLSIAQTNAPAIRDNPRLQAAMLAEFTRENVEKGARLGGRDPDANVYALHNLGDKDGTAFLTALKDNPNQRVDSVLPAKVIHGNKALYGNGSVTVAEAYARMGNFMDDYQKYATEARGMTGQTQTPNPAPQPPGEQTPRPGAGSASPIADGVLVRGEKGPEVRALQEGLIKAGITTIDGKPFVADSDYGPRTEAAVREYQRSRGLKVDGEAGPETLNALRDHKPAKAAETADPARNGVNWPAPGNYKINEKDKPGEGRGEFGTPRGDHRHGGVDIQGNRGDPIESFMPGRVIAVKPNNGDAGNMIVIDHGNGLTSTYMHLDKMYAKVGQKVPEDVEVIGTMGRSGNTPKQGDTHLHFEIHDAKAVTAQNPKGRVDPMPYLSGAKEVDAPAAARTELKSGDKGADVAHLQNRLNALGYTDAAGNKLVPDKDFGTHTKEAVQQFQRENGLKETGVADKETLRLVEKGMTRHAAADGQLQQGEKGPDVRGLQENLNLLKMTSDDGKPLSVDGDYGKATREAVIRFQQANGLPETGTADRTTLEKLGSQVMHDAKVNVEGHVVAPVSDPVQKSTPQQTPSPSPTQPAPADRPQQEAFDPNLKFGDRLPPEVLEMMRKNSENNPLTRELNRQLAEIQHPHGGQVPADRAAPQQAIDAQRPSIADPRHPDHALYEQAKQQLQQLGPGGGFRSQDELGKAAAAVAADAKASGLNSIDHVSKTSTPSGQSLLIAVEGDPRNPAAKNAYIDYGQATTQPVEQSSRMAEAVRTQQAGQPAPTPQQDQEQTPKAVAQR